MQYDKLTFGARFLTIAPALLLVFFYISLNIIIDVLHVT